MSRHTISPDALRTVCPNLSQADAARIAAGLGEAFHRFGINTERRAAMAVAQWAHESDRFKTSQEYASGSAYEGRKDLGNTQRGDGVRFKGRGRIMVTGRANYAAMAKALGLDLLGKPELLAQSPHSELASGQWWKDHDCNSFCDRDDFVGLTRRINGGVNGLADRQALYGTARKVAKDLVPRDTDTDQWAALTKEERAQMDVLAAERRIAKRNGGWEGVDPSHLKRAQEAKAWLIKRREELLGLAQRESQGWDKASRRERYDVIKAATDQ
jgi:putative chitinase